MCTIRRDVYAIFGFPVFLVLMDRAGTETMHVQVYNVHCILGYLVKKFPSKLKMVTGFLVACVLEFCLGLEFKENS